VCVGCQKVTPHDTQSEEFPMRCIRTTETGVYRMSEYLCIRLNGIVCIFSHPTHILTPYTNLYSHTLHTCGWMWLVSHNGLNPGCQNVSVFVDMGSFVNSHTLHIFSHPTQIYIRTPYTPADVHGSSLIRDLNQLRGRSSAISGSWIVYSHTLHNKH